MNSEMLKGNWNQIKGGVKEAFGKLTNDDLLQLEGSLDRAAGVLQERYGYSKERAQQEWDVFLDKYNRAAGSVANETNGYLQDTHNDASTKVDQWADKGSQAIKNAADSVKNTADSVKEKLRV